MATVIPTRNTPPTQGTGWTAADLVKRFGPIPLDRIVFHPRPGTATVEDAVRLDDHEDRLCELIDGVLLKKTVGLIESLIAVQIISALTNYLTVNKLGIAVGADGMMQLFPGQVRIPDASFISWHQLEDSGFPDQAAPNMAPGPGRRSAQPRQHSQGNGAEARRVLCRRHTAGVARRAAG